jgi:hypothetical protein
MVISHNDQIKTYTDMDIVINMNDIFSKVCVGKINKYVTYTFYPYFHHNLCLFNYN